MKLRWLFPLIAAVIGFLAGYVGAPIPNAVKNGGASAPSATGEAGGASSAADAERTALRARVTRAVRSASSLRRDGELAGIVAELSGAQIAEVLEDARKRDAAYFRQLLPPFLKRWAALDPAAAAAFAGTLQLSLNAHYDAVGIISQAWLLRDPVALNRWLRSLPIGTGWAGELQSTITDSQEFASNPAGLLGRLVEARFFNGNPARTLEAIVGDWAKKDPGAALAFAAGLNDRTIRGGAASSAFSAWLETDESAALKWFDGITDAKLRDGLIGSVLQIVAKKDPARAEELIDSMQPSLERNTMRTRLAWMTTPNEPARLGEMVESMDFDSTSHTLGVLYSKWATFAPADAIASFLHKAGSSDSNDDIQLFRSLLSSTGRGGDNFPRIGDTLMENIAEPMSEVGKVGLKEFASAWAQRDLDGLAKWIASVPEGQRREELVVPAASRMAYRPPEAFVPWLTTMPAGPSKLAAVTTTVDALISSNLPNARAALDVLPETERAGVFANSWKKWAKWNPDAAAKWRDTNPDLSDTERATLRSAK